MTVRPKGRDGGVYHRQRRGESSAAMAGVVDRLGGSVDDANGSTSSNREVVVPDRLRPACPSDNIAAITSWRTWVVGQRLAHYTIASGQRHRNPDAGHMRGAAAAGAGRAGESPRPELVARRAISSPTCAPGIGTRDVNQLWVLRVDDGEAIAVTDGTTGAHRVSRPRATGSRFIPAGKETSMSGWFRSRAGRRPRSPADRSRTCFRRGLRRDSGSLFTARQQKAAARTCLSCRRAGATRARSARGTSPSTFRYGDVWVMDVTADNDR